MMCMVIMVTIQRISGATFEFAVPAIGTSPNVTMYEVPSVQSNMDYDFHPVHGCEITGNTYDGYYAYVGKCMPPGLNGKNSPFVEIITPTGTNQWMWTQPSVEGAMNAVIHLPNENDILVAGWKKVGSVGKRYLARLNLLTSSVVWEATDFGDNSASSNGAWEMIDISADGLSIILSGVREIPSLTDGDETAMAFKSYGNVAGGRAVVMQIPISSLTGSAPTSSSATWTTEYTSASYTTAKAARPIGSTDEIAVLLWGEETDGNSAMLDKLSASTGQSLLSGGTPREFGVAHGEGTDMAVSVDGTSIYITGHGSSPLIQGGSELYGKITKVRVSDYVQQFTRGYASCDVSSTPSCWPIKNECWGIAALANGNVVVGCGTGIEDCRSPMPSSQQAQCNAEPSQPITGVDTRDNSVPYRVATWRSLAIEVDSDGDVVWQRVDAYKGVDDTNAIEHGSSASEYVFVKSDGNLTFVQDEVLGVGILVIGGGAYTGVPASPTPTPDDDGSSDDSNEKTILYVAISAGAVIVIIVVGMLCWITMRSKR